MREKRTGKKNGLLSRNNCHGAGRELLHSTLTGAPVRLLLGENSRKGAADEQDPEAGADRANRSMDSRE